MRIASGDSLDYEEQYEREEKKALEGIADITDGSFRRKYNGYRKKGRGHSEQAPEKAQARMQTAPAHGAEGVLQLWRER